MKNDAPFINRRGLTERELDERNAEKLRAAPPPVQPKPQPPKRMSDDEREFPWLWLLYFFAVLAGAVLPALFERLR